MNTLALFDFDGTITTKDSLVDFIQFAVGRPKYYLGLFQLSIMLTAYTLKLIPNYVAKEKLITHFFKGWGINKFKEIASAYSLKQIDFITRSKAIERVRWHQAQGHEVVIVSASIDCWLIAWCEKNNIQLVSTQLEVHNNKLSGKFSGKNCYGIEKINKLKKVYDLDNFEYIYAYGDSSGDKELLSIANESFYKPFRE